MSDMQMMRRMTVEQLEEEINQRLEYYEKLKNEGPGFGEDDFDEICFEIERELNCMLEILEFKNDLTKREQIIQEILSLPSAVDVGTTMGIILWYEQNNIPLEKLLSISKDRLGI